MVNQAGNGGLIFNLSGGVILLTVAMYMGYSFFRGEDVTPCATRYPAGKQFAFDTRGGKPLSPIEMQGRAGSREWGVLNNTRVRKAADIPRGFSLKVDLAPTGDEANENQNGIGFVWPNQNMSQAKSACLSYNVFLPQKYAFPEPGIFPGIYSTSDIWDLDSREMSEGFAARVGWGQGGDVGLDMKSARGGSFWQGSTSRSTWPLGRWVPVEQEVIINRAGVADGIVRLWVDGHLRVDRRDLELRYNRREQLSGVVADVGYARTASDPISVMLSPFVLQWQ